MPFDLKNPFGPAGQQGPKSSQSSKIPNSGLFVIHFAYPDSIIIRRKKGGFEDTNSSLRVREVKSLIILDFSLGCEQIHKQSYQTQPDAKIWYLCLRLTQISWPPGPWNLHQTASSKFTAQYWALLQKYALVRFILLLFGIQDRCTTEIKHYNIYASSLLYLH